MTPATLPGPLEWITSSFLLILAVGLVALHTALAALAETSASDRPRNPLAPALVGAFLSVWLGVAIAISHGAGSPLLRDDLRSLTGALVGLGPMAIAIAALAASPTIRRTYTAMPADWLVRAQTYRAAGLIFLYPLLAYGIVPAEFAVPAAIGDLVTGALAPFVARAVAERRPHALRWATAWNLFGVLDLLVAPVAAVLSQAPVLVLFPLSLVPLFTGTPIGILTHIYSLRNLAATRRVGTEAREVVAPATQPGRSGLAGDLRRA
jgi:hypothetical protein